MKLPVQTAEAYPDQRTATANAMADTVRRNLISLLTAFERQGYFLNFHVGSLCPDDGRYRGKTEAVDDRFGGIEHWPADASLNIPGRPIRHEQHDCRVRLVPGTGEPFDLLPVAPVYDNQGLSKRHVAEGVEGISLRVEDAPLPVRYVLLQRVRHVDQITPRLACPGQVLQVARPVLLGPDLHEHLLRVDAPGPVLHLGQGVCFCDRVCLANGSQILCKCLEGEQEQGWRYQ